MTDSAGQSKKRLLYLSGALRVSTQPQATVGGARAHVLGVINAFMNLHWHVDTYIVGDRVPRPGWSRGFDSRLRSSLGLRIAADLVRLFAGIVSRWRLAGKFRQTDWVYERSGLFQNLGSRCNKNGIPWILEANALISQEAFLDRRAIFFYRLAKKMELQAYRRCDALVCVSESLQEQIVAFSGIDPRKALVVANGVDTDLFNPAIHPVKRFFKEPTIGFVGTMYPWQGLHLLLTVLAELSKEGIGLKLVMVGDGPELDGLRRQAVALGLSDDVHFAGRVEWRDVPAAIAGVDIGFSGQVSTASGAWNGSPIKIYEFMAMKKPVIASAFEDAARTIAAGRSGYLFQPDNAAALKQSIKTAYREKEKWPALGELARKEIERSCGWTERVRNMIDQIETILRQK